VKKIKAELIDAVAALFDKSLMGEQVSGKILEMSLGQRIQSAPPGFVTTMQTKNDSRLD
jgi:hypothetical protein